MEPGSETSALCGFSRCRTPLPPPGPRGGRPYEFCPERVWPGNATCKQLAAAENALRAAVGAEPGTLALGGFATEVREHVERALAPAEALKGVLVQVAGRLDTEVAAALVAVEASDRAAAEDRGLRERAQGVAAEADQAAALARAATAEHEAARAAAEHARDEAVARTKAAELKQARAETRRDAEHERAEHAEHRARDASHREQVATEAAAAARVEVAAVRAELAGVQQQLVEERSGATRAAQRAEAEVSTAREDAADARAESAKAVERHSAESAQVANRHSAELERMAQRHRAESERAADRAESKLAEVGHGHQAVIADLHQQLGAARHRAEVAEVEAAALRGPVSSEPA